MNYAIPKLSRPSQWYSTDRDCSCRTFASAAAYNTQNNSSQFYKPIDQIHEYYSWATKEIEKISPVRFFHAAQDVTGILSVGGAFYLPYSIEVSSTFPFVAFSALSERGRKSLADVNVILLAQNMPVIKSIINTGASSAVQGTGIVWDFNYVISEQQAVTNYIRQNPIGTDDAGIINRNFEKFESINFQFTLAKILAGTNLLDYREPVHRFAIGRSLVFLRHADRPNFIGSQLYNDAIQYLTDKYGSNKTDYFIGLFLASKSYRYPKP